MPKEQILNSHFGGSFFYVTLPPSWVRLDSVMTPLFHRYFSVSERRMNGHRTESEGIIARGGGFCAYLTWNGMFSVETKPVPSRT